MSKNRKKKKKKKKTSTLVDLKNLDVDKNDLSEPRCKRCAHFGKDENKCGVCELTGENVARNHSCQENFKRKKKTSTSASSSA